MAAACLLFACSGDDTSTVGTIEPAGADAPASGASTATESPPISSAEYPERFDAKHFTVTPEGENGVRIREVVDVDFGSADRHGYVRVIANDFGVPTDVTAVSPDAPADLAVEQTGPSETAILIGDPDSVVSGQHRYVVTYTLPDAQLADGVLALDIIGTDGVLETDRVEVVVTGLELADPTCNVGPPGTSGGCVLEPDGDVYRAVISPLEVGHGITIGGTIAERTTPANVPEPPVPPRR